MEVHVAEKEKFTEQDVELLYGLFLSTDANNDGKLDLDEFSSLGAHDNPEELFRMFDHNEDGLLDFQEFTAAIIFVSPGTAKQKLEWLFNIYDIDRNGVLTSNEIASLLLLIKSAAKRIVGVDEEKTSEIEKSMIHKLDPDCNCTISLTEWLSFSLSTTTLLDLLGPCVGM